MDLDRVLAGGSVVDGTGARAYRADVGVRAGRIAAIGDLAGAPAGERLDVTGRVVCPGFIDMHTHSDLSLFLCPTGDSKVYQGVTTEVVGNCGFSPAPLLDATAATVRSLHGFFGDFVERLGWDWRSYGDFAAALGQGGLGLNVAPLVGHVTLRATVMEYAQRPPTDAELEPDAAAHAGGDARRLLRALHGARLSPRRLRGHRGAGRGRPGRGRGRRLLREPHPRRGVLAPARGGRGPRDRRAGAAPGPDLAPQGVLPPVLGAAAPRAAALGVGAGARPGGRVRRLPVHGRQRAPDPDRARLGPRGRARRAGGPPAGPGDASAPRPGDRRAGARVGPDAGGVAPGGAGQGRRGMLAGRHRRAPDRPIPSPRSSPSSRSRRGGPPWSTS